MTDRMTTILDPQSLDEAVALAKAIVKRAEDEQTMLTLARAVVTLAEYPDAVTEFLGSLRETLTTDAALPVRYQRKAKTEEVEL